MMSGINPVKNTTFWQNLAPKKKRVVMIMAMAVGLGVFVWILLPADKNPAHRQRVDVNGRVLANIDTRKIGIESLAAELRQQQQIVAKQQDTIRLLEKGVKTNREAGLADGAQNRVQELEQKIKNIESSLAEQGWSIKDLKTFGIVEKNAESNTTNTSTPPPSQALPIAARPLTPFESASPVVTTAGENHVVEPLKIVNLSAQPTQEELDAKQQENSVTIFIPSGSIISGILMNGIDALTADGARDNPFPALVRVKADAILPNEYRADVKECFALLGGYGDLSSTRAMLRGESFSCVTEDKRYIQTAFPAYAVGEDGKAGLRGKLIDKAWPIIKNTSIAGFFSGVAEAFSSTPVAAINVNGSGSRQFIKNLSKDTLQNGVSSGASRGFEKIADWYMRLADKIYPVIEIDAKRKVDMIVTEGFYLEIMQDRKNKAATPIPAQK